VVAIATVYCIISTVSCTDFGFLAQRNYTKVGQNTKSQHYQLHGMYVTSTHLGFSCILNWRWSKLLVFSAIAIWVGARQKYEMKWYTVDWLKPLLFQSPWSMLHCRTSCTVNHPPMPSTSLLLPHIYHGHDNWNIDKNKMALLCTTAKSWKPKYKLDIGYEKLRPITTG